MKVTLGNAVARWAVVSTSAMAVAASMFGALTVSSARAELIMGPVKNSCTIARNNDVALVIGKVIRPASQLGPAPDAENPSATSTSCSFEGVSGLLTINVLQFATPDVANTELSHTIETFQASNDGSTDRFDVAQEAGLGQSAYWIVSKVQSNVDDPNSIVTKATYISLANNSVVTVGTDWSDSTPDQLKPALFKLTKAVVDHF